MSENTNPNLDLTVLLQNPAIAKVVEKEVGKESVEQFFKSSFSIKNAKEAISKLSSYENILFIAHISGLLAAVGEQKSETNEFLFEAVKKFDDKQLMQLLAYATKTKNFVTPRKQKGMIRLDNPPCPL